MKEEGREIEDEGGRKRDGRQGKKGKRWRMRDERRETRIMVKGKR